MILNLLEEYHHDAGFDCGYAAREDLKKFCLHWEMTNIESSTVARRPQQIFSDRAYRVIKVSA